MSRRKFAIQLLGGCTKLILVIGLFAGASFGQAGALSKTELFTGVAAGSSTGTQGTKANFHKLFWYPAGTVSTCTVELQQSSDGATWSSTIIAGQTCTSSGQSTLTAGIANFVRINVTALTGGGTVTVTSVGYDVPNGTLRDPLVNSAAGGYVRQDSTATMAKETNGYLQQAALSLSTIVDSLHTVAFPFSPQAKAGFSIRTGVLNRPVDRNNPLPVFLPPPEDPCVRHKDSVAISQIASTQLVVGRPGNRIFICYARVVAAAAEILSFIEGTGAACATGALAVTGSTTAANGESYAANSGFSGGGNFAIAMTTVYGNDLCLIQNGTNRLSGNITYVYAP